MSQTPNQSVHSRSSRAAHEERVTYQSHTRQQYQDRSGLNQLQRNNLGGAHELVYRSFKFPTDIGFDGLVEKKGVLTDLLREFQSGQDRIVFDLSKKDEYSKRLMLLEHQIEGLMRQSFMYEQNSASGNRTLDYSSLINEKENQIVELEKKIAHLEGQYRKYDHRIIELEKEVEKLHRIILDKNRIIKQLQDKDRAWLSESLVEGDASNYAKELQKKLQQFEGKKLSMSQLDGAIEAWIFGLPESSRIKQKMQVAEFKMLNQDKYRAYFMSKLTDISSQYKKQIDSIKTSTRTNVTYDETILKTLSLKDERDPVFESVFGGYISPNSKESDFISEFYSKFRTGDYVRQIEVPVQDARTKMLIVNLSKEMNRLVTKYPKLRKQMKSQLLEFVSQQIIDTMEVDEFDRLVSIVKYEPQVVKVENVYAYSSQKSRKVEFHLRVLIKALLEEMEKVKLKHGIDLEIDSGVVGMIKQQIMDVVDVDDILKVYRVVPKIVEVEKVIEKVRDHIIYAPQMIPINTETHYPVEVRKVDVVEKTVNVPVQYQTSKALYREKGVRLPKYVDKLVEGTELEQYVVETEKQFPKNMVFEKIVPLPEEIVKIVEVPGPERIVEVPSQPKVIHITNDKIVETVFEKEIIKPIDRFSEKIVEVIRQVPKVVPVEIIREKLVVDKQYLESEKIINNIIREPYGVDLNVEKVVAITNVEHKIIEIPQSIQKIVKVTETREIPKVVEIVKEVLAVQQQVQVVERIREVPVVEVREQMRVVDRIVQVPLVETKVKVEKEYRKEPVIHKLEEIIHEEVKVEVPVVMYEQIPVQVERFVNHYVKDQEPVILTRDRIVELETVRDNIVATPTIIEKIVQKIVEVPKIVEIEKIVQKIVPVPRVVEKIVEVEKIIEKIVEKIIIQERIKIVEQRVEVPIIKEIIREIEVPRNIYMKSEVPKEVVREKMVKDIVRETIKEVHNIEQPPRVVIQTRYQDVEMVVQKIVTLRTYDNKFVELKEQVIVPVNMPTPVPIHIDRFIPIEHTKVVVETVDRFIDRIVPVRDVHREVVTVPEIKEVLRVQKEYEVVKDQIPYYNVEHRQVEVMVEKIMEPIYYEVQKIIEVPFTVQKIVEAIHKVPQIYQVPTRVQVAVDKPFIFTIDRIVPEIVTLNKTIEKIVDKIVEVPTILQKIQEIQSIREKNIKVGGMETQYHEELLKVEEEVIREKLIHVEEIVHHISESMKVVDKIIDRDRDPVIITQQRVMEVPFIVEKIVERIVVMPQIVEVLKYVHEIMDTEKLGTAVSEQIGVEEGEYQRLAKNLNGELSRLRVLLGNMKKDGQYRSEVAIIDSFLSEFNKFIVYPRIREVFTEKVVNSVVEKEKIVRVPVGSGDDEKRNLASAVLIDKLVIELRRLKQANPNIKYQLDSDILDIFGTQLNPISREYGNNYNKLLDEYTKSIFTRFNSSGNWSRDSLFMLEDYINERFDLAFKLKKTENELAKYRTKYESASNKEIKYKDHIEDIKERFRPFDEIFPVIIDEAIKQGRLDTLTKKKYESMALQINEAVFGYAMAIKPKQLDSIEYSRISSVVREKQEEIIRLKERIAELLRNNKQSQIPTDHRACNNRIRDLETEIKRLRIIEQQHKGCEDKIKRLLIIEEEHFSCRRRIDQLLAEIQRYKKGGQKQEAYGTHFQQYANNAEDSSEEYNSQRLRAANQYRVKQYGSAGGESGHNQRSTQYLSDSRGSGDLGGELGSHRRNVYQSSFQQRVEYSSGEGSSYQNIEYTTNKGSQIEEFQSGRMKQSGFQNSESGGSKLYGNSNREIIRRTYKQEQGSGSDIKRYQRDPR